jgi:hypothetical protein
MGLALNRRRMGAWSVCCTTVYVRASVRVVYVQKPFLMLHWEASCALDWMQHMQQLYNVSVLQLLWLLRLVLPNLCSRN